MKKLDQIVITILSIIIFYSLALMAFQEPQTWVSFVKCTQQVIKEIVDGSYFRS